MTQLRVAKRFNSAKLNAGTPLFYDGIQGGAEWWPKVPGGFFEHVHILSTSYVNRRVS